MYRTSKGNRHTLQQGAVPTKKKAPRQFIPFLFKGHETKEGKGNEGGKDAARRSRADKLLSDTSSLLYKKQKTKRQTTIFGGNCSHSEVVEVPHVAWLISADLTR